MGGSPNTWLRGFNAGIGLPSGGVDYLSKSVVPFIVNYALVALIIVSLAFLLLGGIQWVTSSGSKEPLAKAKATITYAVLGLALGLGSFLILNYIGSLFNIKFF